MDAVDDAMRAAHHIIDVGDARAGSAVRGNLDGLGASALPCREQGAQVGVPDPARAAVHLGRTNNGDVEYVTGSEDGLLVTGSPANCSGGFALGQTRSGGNCVRGRAVLIAVHPGAGNVDEAELRARDAFFGEGGDAGLGGGFNGIEECAGAFVGRGGVNHDVDGYGGDEMGEAARIGNIADDGKDFVLDEGFGFGGVAGETVDGVVARAEEGFGKREAKVATRTKDEDGRHGDDIDLGYFNEK